MKIYRVIGLMSGTSLDGIDAALLQTDGEGHIVREAFLTVPYDEGLRAEIRGCFGKTAEQAREVELALTVAHAEAVRQLLETTQAGEVDLIGFHGQTISHAPALGHTCQIGDGALLAAMTGIKVVNDFRTADVRAGGQGAPLVPVYHQALGSKLDKPVVFLNIGGVANVTYVGRNGELIAFDTGPGNALIDDWMLKKIGHKFDAGGKISLSGRVDEAVLGQLLGHPFFASPVPKSLDRNDFVSQAWEHLSVADGAATLAAFTVQSIVKAAQHFPEPPKQWVVAGGGRHNQFLMRQLQQHTHVPVLSIDALGLDGDAIEAEAFAYLAVRSIKGLPISFPSTTGVPQPMTGGRLYP
ncbi:MAG: anhydro-N-acetylmuramic acid kinase [Alphaproteobacteria bacterium]|nr:anhydro-N-acetylmuramic acid kinase [Alphaproteobacteria bacterium]